MRIGYVSDVCLGYGSPQIGYLAESIAESCGAESLLIEPRIPTLPPRHNDYPFLKVRRSRTVFDPYSTNGRKEYILEATRIMDDWQPDVLVICCTFTLPVLFKLRKRPPYVIYYSYESVAAYGDFDLMMNRQLAGKVDLVIFPEKNRAALEISRCRFGDAPKVVLYNCPRLNSRAALPKHARNGRFLYAGRIDPVETLAEHFANSRIKGYPIDLYGPISLPSGAERDAFVASLQEGVRYNGRVENRFLAKLRLPYIYSLVMWNPHNDNQLYAAPNKFFEAIADGVPPLTAPHPQCKSVIESYNCGLLMADWSAEELVRTLELATALYATDAWEQLVANCETAFHKELNWERQFEKLRVHLGGHL